MPCRQSADCQFSFEWPAFLPQNFASLQLLGSCSAPVRDPSQSYGPDIMAKCKKKIEPPKKVHHLRLFLVGESRLYYITHTKIFAFSWLNSVLPFCNSLIFSVEAFDRVSNWVWRSFTSAYHFNNVKKKFPKLKNYRKIEN